MKIDKDKLLILKIIIKIKYKGEVVLTESEIKEKIDKKIN